MTTKEYINKVVAIDALEGMKNLDTNSIDLIFSGVPYPSSLRKIGVEFEEYTDWLSPFVKEMYRILKPSGSYVVMAQSPPKKVVDTWVHEMVIFLTKEIKFPLLQELYWFKPGTPPSGLASIHKRCRSSVEFIFWFGKDPNETKVDTKKVLREFPNYINTLEKMGNRQKNTIETTKDKKDVSQVAISKCFMSVEKSGSTPFNVIVASPVVHNDPIYDIMRSLNLGHTGRVPEFMPAFFIKMLTDPGDIVLDPFVGSGSTATASKRLDRKYIGLDIDKDYIKLTEARLKTFAKSRILDEWI